MNGIAQRQTSRFATFILPALLLTGCFGTGEGPEPIAGTPAPPPDPTPDFCFDSITFEEVCGQFDFIDPNSGEPGFEGGVTLLVNNPDRDGLNTSERVAQMQKFRADSGLTFGGSTLQRPDGVDFSAGETVKMLVWASRPVPVTFKFDGLDTERVADHSGSGEWEELCFDFTGATPGELTATTITFIFDLENLGDAADNPNDWTFYFDEITLVEEACDGGGGGAQVSLPVTFDDAAVDYDLVDFGDPVPAATTLVADPTDAANTVASTNKPVGTPTWAGTTVGGTNGLAAAIPFTATETTMTVRVYSPDAGIPVRLKVEDAADPNISVETEVLTGVANEWETLTFDFSVQVAGTAPLDLANTYDKLSIFFNFGTDGNAAGDKTYLWDDVEFVGPGAGGDAPVVAAPTPTQDEANVISLYSDAYVDSVAETWPTGWSGVGSVSDVTIEGGLTKEHLDTDFVGVEFASLDVSGMTHFHMDIWTPDAESLLVKLVDFGGDGFGGGNDTEGPIVFDGAAGNQPAPAQGQWVSLDISLADMQAAGLGSLTDINQLVFALTPAGTTTIYVDNVYFYNDNAGGGGDAPVVAAPTPTQDAADVISLYSDAYTDITVTWPTGWSGVGSVTDVTIEGGLTKEHLDTDFVGVEFASLDVSGMTHFHMDIWTPDAESLLVKLVDFGGDGFGGGNDTEGPIVFDGAAGNQPAPAQGQWVSLDISLADMQAAGLGSLTDINQLVFALTPAGTTTIYVDNVYFYNDNAGGGGDAPVVAAPTPTQDAANVISMFSDAYVDVNVDTWRTDWSVATLAEVLIDGNPTKEYTVLDFVGIETVAAPLDVSGMTHFRMDIWTPNTESLTVKLVDFGGDGFGGGNDTEGPIVFDGAAGNQPAPAQGQWVSLDISLADMQAAGLGSLTDINQLVIAATPAGTTTLYVDNVYFYNDNAGGGGGTFVNGDFETGDLTGWTPVTIPDGVGSITLDSSGQGGRAGTVARLQAAGSVASGNDVLLSQVALGAGTIQAGDTIDVSFDLFGSLAGAGGVVFVEIIFLNGAGEDVGGRDFVGPAAPYTPTNAWTTHSGTVIAGTAVGGGQFDVSGGVTLQLKAACGPVDGCGVDAYFDNVTFTINGGGQ